ncbi:CFI-box-CTERM domain-containing protein [Kaarinaea lacus]
MFALIFRSTISVLPSLCLPMISLAATITVNTTNDDSVTNGNCTLREALFAANNDSVMDQCDAGSGDDSVVFNSGVTGTILLNTSLPPIEENLTITGPGAALLAIDANGGAFTVLTIDSPGDNISVAISGLNITNANNSSDAGGVLVESGDTITFRSCQITNNIAANGAGIKNNGTLTLNATLVSGNSATFLGGAILNLGTLNITNNSNIGAINAMNVAGSYGGGIYIHTGSVSIANSTVAGNEANGGGGIYNFAGSVSITNTSVVGNTATNGGGGGIYNENVSSAVTIITGSQILTNSAVNGGGIFHADSISNLAISESEISDNSASANGAGIYAQGPLTLTDSTLSGNVATGNGGAILHVSFGAITLSNCIIGPNNAADQGGGIYGFNSSASIIDCSIYENTATLVGGGLYNSDGTVVLANSTVGPTNTANQGGGILNGGTLHITNSTLSGNTATVGDGGGLYHGSGSTSLNNVTIADNSSVTASGGGLFVSAGTIEMQNTILADNIDASGNPDCSGPVTSIGNNLIGVSTGCLPLMVIDLIDLDAELNGLADNGGVTLTHALKSTSPAIDAGNPIGCFDYDGSTLTADQRGKLRPADGDRDGVSRCDIGAYEYSPAVGDGDDGGFCFIATAAYGSYLHPHVQLLREFRDKYLLTNNMGRFLVQWYYDHSPPLADGIAADERLRALVRWLLTPVVYAVVYPKAAGSFLLVFVITLATLVVRRGKVRQRMRS